MAVAVAPASAHRRDEYLQAARLAIGPDRVDLSLDLTPGIAVADTVLGGIDRDGDGTIATDEAEAYAARLLEALSLDVDGRPLPLQLVRTLFPTVESARAGEGAIQIEVIAPLPRLSLGRHDLRFSNRHRPEISVYLANALVPESERISIGAQRRDVEQRSMTIEYELRPGAAARTGTAVALAGSVVWLIRRRRPSAGR